MPKRNRDLKTHISLLLFCLAAMASLPSRAAAAIDWYSSIEEASAVAQQSNKPMLIDFWATWCVACKVMESDVYTDNGVIETFHRLLPVRIDYDHKQAIARKYKVEALPTIVFTDSFGAELFRFSGYISVKILTELLRALPADVSEFNRLNKVLAEDKNNFEALDQMGRSLRAAGLYRNSNDYYARALQRNEAKSNASNRESIMAEMGRNLLEVKEGKLAADLYEKCLKEFPASPRKPEFTLNLGRAYIEAEKKEKARKLLEGFLREHPDSAEAEKAKSLLASL